MITPLQTCSGTSAAGRAGSAIAAKLIVARERCEST